MKYTRELLEKAVRDSSSVHGVLKLLGLSGGGSHSLVVRRIKEFGIDTSHFLRRGRAAPDAIRYTREVLEKAVRESISVAGVLRALGLRQAGGTHSHVARRIKHFGIDTSHFLGQRANSGERHKGCVRRTPDEILVKREQGNRQAAFRLRRALIAIGREYRCGRCGIEPLWCGAKLVFQVDHKNRDFLDDRAENLQFLCPNCHSQTDGWCGSRGLTDLTSVARQNRDYWARKRGKQREC